MDLGLFHFIRPFWWLALFPGLGLLFLLMKKSLRGNVWQQVCDAHLLPHLLVRTSTSKRHIYFWLLAIAWLLVITALAGPTWERIPQPIFQSEQAKVVVLNLSPSMLASDVVPSRFMRAKYKVVDILKRIHEGQVGMVVFSGEPFVVSPLTQDAVTIITLIPELSPYMMPISGNRIAPALKMAGKLLQQSGLSQGQILLLTDGEASTTDLNVAKELHQHGFELRILGIGSASGSPISLPKGGFLQDNNGNIVITKTDKASLTQLANVAGGFFVNFSDDDKDVETILADSTGEPFVMAAKKSKQVTELWRDEGYWFLLPVLFIAAFAFRRGLLMELFGVGRRTA